MYAVILTLLLCFERSNSLLRIARNIILLTMAADGHSPSTVIWNVYIHMHLDDKSHATLVEHCSKLINHSETIQSWRNSPYGHYIKMCTAYTLEEVRRHWRLYAEMKTLPDKRIKAIREALKAVAKSRPSKTLGNGARSAGPFMIHAFDAAAKLEDHYWKTGTTFFDDALDTAATKLNPTMVYSLGGEGCNVHYGTDPVTPFHLALAFSDSPHSVRPHDLVEVAKDQFKDWCTSFKASTSPTKPMNPVVRFIVGEATAVSRSLQLFVETGSSSSFIPVAPWKSQLLVLSEGDLSSALRRDTEDIPPPLFNVIDTSNLVDHIGMYAQQCFRPRSSITMSRYFERPDRRDPNAFRIPPRECHVHRVTHIQREQCHQGLH